MSVENIVQGAAHFGLGKMDARGARYAQLCQTLTHRSLMQKRVKNLNPIYYVIPEVLLLRKQHNLLVTLLKLILCHCDRY